MSVSRAIEVERKYAVPDGAALPGFAGLDVVVAADAQPVARLDAVYVDTASRTLLAARIAVRRRSGGHDAGWHVKLPATGGRAELHAPIDAEDPDALPAALELVLRTRLRGRPLEPIARIRTERHGVVVSGAGGARIEVVDDHVTATDLGAGVLRAWREWEAELVGEPEASAALLETVHDALCAAGAVPSASPAKLAQALGLVGRPDGPAPTTAGGALAAAVAAHAEDLHRGAQALVLDGDLDGTAVEGMLATVRTLRALLALAPVAGPGGAALRPGLAALGARLRAVRDARAAAVAAEELLDGLRPGTPGLVAARTALVDEPLAAQPRLVGELVEHLRSPAVLDLVDAVERVEPDGEQAGGPPAALADAADRAVRRARRRAADALEGDDPDDLHRARRATRRAGAVVRALLAAGLVEPGSRLARAGARAERAGARLGEHRDLALLLASLPAASERVTAAGGNAFALGGAARRGEQRLARLLRRAGRALERVR